MAESASADELIGILKALSQCRCRVLRADQPGQAKRLHQHVIPLLKKLGYTSRPMSSRMLRQAAPSGDY